MGLFDSLFKQAESVVKSTVRKEATKAVNKAVSEAVSIPVIASGGAGELDDFRSVFTDTKVASALAASVFHYNEINIKELIWVKKQETEKIELCWSPEWDLEKHTSRIWKLSAGSVN